MYTQVQQRSLLDHPWRIAALVTIVANVSFNYLSQFALRDGATVADVSAAYPTLLTPEHYAFAIWGAIYATTLLYAVWAMLPSQLEVRFHDRVAPWLLLENALASAWVLLFSAQHLVSSFVICLAMLATAVRMFTLAGAHAQSEGLSRLWRAPFGLWLGWLCVASVANLSIVSTAMGWLSAPWASIAWSVFWLCALAAVALVAYSAARDAVVPLVIAWSAVAIAVAHWHESTLVGLVAAFVATKALLWAGATFLFEKFPMPARYARAAGRALQYDPKHPDGF